jgi:hypothetical protein
LVQLHGPLRLSAQPSLAANRPTPAEPVCGQHTQADGREILLEIKKAQPMPMAIAFKVWLSINFEIQLHDCSEQPGDQIQNDDGVGETRA